MQVVKRDGSIVDFDSSKIAIALNKAFKATSETLKNGDSEFSIAEAITDKIKNKNQIKIEDIQNLVEKELMESGYYDTAKAYILYRNQRTSQREKNTRLMTNLRTMFDFEKNSNNRRENANIDGNTAMGSMLKFGSETAKEYVKMFVLKPEHAEAHRNGDIHIHDMDFLSIGTTTCTQIDLEHLFKNGFNTGHGFLRTPNSIRTASQQACIAIQSNQNEQHGGQSIPNFDRFMAPYVAKSYKKALKLILEHQNPSVLNKSNIINIINDISAYIDENKSILDKKGQLFIRNRLSLENISDENIALMMDSTVKDTENEVYQSMEALIHNLNTLHSRAGAQVPFSSLNYGTDTSPEARMVVKNLLLATDAGLGEGETPIFPIQIFRCKHGINFDEGDPNYDLFKLACKVSAKRMFPNFSFQDAPFNAQYYNPDNPKTEISYMGCAVGDSEIQLKIENKLYAISIGKAYNMLADMFPEAVKTQGVTDYVDLTNKNITVFDSRKNDFVICKKILRNPNMNNWYEVKTYDGHVLYLTADHPLATKDRGRVLVSDLTCEDSLIAANKPYIRKHIDTRYLRIKSITPVKLDEQSYDVETESDMFDLCGVQSHNCRTRVIGNVNGPEETYSRGNLSFTSINLPRLGILAAGDWDKFYKLLDDRLELVCDQLLDRLAVQSAKLAKNFPFLMSQGNWLDGEKLDKENEVRDILKNGSLAIGFIGLAECLVAMMGVHHGESEEAQKRGLEIVGRIRSFTDAMTEKYHLNFSTFATPAEGLSGRFTQIDKKKFGIIKGVTDKEYYTNSFHVPVWFTENFYHKLEIEGPYHALTNGGHISYVEIDGDPSKNLEAFETIIRCMDENHIGYGAVNHPIDRDPVCGYDGIIEGNICPNCGRDCTKDNIGFERIRRITGYLVGTLDRFNNAKRAEVNDRVKHDA